MHSVEGLPPDFVAPPFPALISGRPTSLFGESVEWLIDEEPVPVFVGRFDDAPSPPVDLFGARYEMADAILDGELVGSGHVVEFFVVSRRSDAWECWRLAQHDGEIYCESGRSFGAVAAAEVDEGDSAVPRWVSRTNAIWPTHDGKPLPFLGQADLPENDVTRTLLTWNLVVYLFGSRSDRDAHFAVVEQRVSEQSTDDHYTREDELLW